MTFMNKLLTYLGFCPNKESAQGFRVRNNIISLKQGIVGVGSILILILLVGANNIYAGAVTVDTVLRLFGIIVFCLIFVLVAVGGVGLFAGVPRWKAVVFIAGTAIGLSLARYGVRELLSGRQLGVIWIPIGIGLWYIVVREVWPTIAEVLAKRWPQPLVRTRMSRLAELLAFGLLALLLVFILILSGRSDFRWA